MAHNEREIAAAIVRDAGGEITGRTRLQKVVYLAQLAGFGDDFHFEYKHYGPFSEDLAEAMELACVFDLVKEEEKSNQWGGFYSVYRAANSTRTETPDAEKARFITAAARVSAIELELAATAAYLRDRDGVEDPWEETRRRKPEKAGNGRLERAKVAYRRLSQFKTPKPLPPIG